MPEVHYIAYDVEQVELHPSRFGIPAIGDECAAFWRPMLHCSLSYADTSNRQESVHDVAYRMMLHQVQQTSKLSGCAQFRVGVLEVEDGIVTKSYVTKCHVSVEPFVRISVNEFEPQDGDWICDGIEPYYLAGKIGREIKVDYDY